MIFKFSSLVSTVGIETQKRCISKCKGTPFINTCQIITSFFLFFFKKCRFFAFYFLTTNCTNPHEYLVETVEYYDKNKENPSKKREKVRGLLPYYLNYLQDILEMIADGKHHLAAVVLHSLCGCDIVLCMINNTGFIGLCLVIAHERIEVTLLC